MAKRKTVTSDSVEPTGEVETPQVTETAVPVTETETSKPVADPVKPQVVQETAFDGVIIERKVESLNVATVPVIDGPSEDAIGTRRIRISGYKESGNVIVYADGTDLALLEGYDTKQLAYSFRLSVGLAGCGMESLGSAFPVNEKSVPAPLVKPTDKHGVLRKEFKLNPGI